MPRVQSRQILAGMIALLLVGKATGGNRHHVVIDGGMVHLRGGLTASACTVSADSVNQTVDMGPFRSNQFNGVGSLAPPVAFSLRLNDCSKAVSDTVGVAFQGVTDGKDPQVLRAGEGQNAATGIGLALFDNQGELLVPNTAARSWTPLAQGDMTLRFLARYRATSHQVTAGNADAWTWFSLTYQ
ncbi:fimbrial protein [Klebsiella michiganensis]|uniref:fimbrial protein n=1 Tax=Klebsiella michiganensis TaxID=1134687 RepID=UPI0025702AF1|nr:fimbrial protein [Klebsiella michiganensis]MDL4454785.1 fimbrial protein [Klebsiella michiganensis]